MRIRVERMETAPSGRARIFFSGKFGRAKGDWDGEVPEVGSEYDVELDISGTLIWGENIFAMERAVPAIFERESCTIVQGTLESFDGKSADVRLGDSLILVAVDRVDCELPCGIVMKIRELRLFDANV